ncbi:MAG: type II toxin-antitoxin system VapC family toxin [Promethearchaeota archaeon]
MPDSTILYLDTDILIGILHSTYDLAELKSRFERYQSLGTTIINIYELYYGYQQLKYSKPKISEKRLSKEREALDLLIKNLTIVNLTIENVISSTSIYHRLKSKGKMIDLFDCMIAGIILSTNSYDFLTNNQKHFNRITKLNLVTPKGI